jgi:hypothetical protein
MINRLVIFFSKGNKMIFLLLTGATAGLRQPEQLYRNQRNWEHYKCFGGKREEGGLKVFKAGQTHYTNY